VLRGFLLPLVEQQGKKLFSSRAPAWVSLNPYPDGTTAFLDTARVSKRYWASLQTSLTDPKRLFLLYLHHSTVRCLQANAGSNPPEVDFTVNGCPRGPDGQPVFLSRNSYDARIWTSNKYQDSLPLLDLGPADGTFDVQWITPATGSATAPQTIVWDGHRKTCNGGNCVIQSPLYSFDLALRVQQR